MTESLPYLVFVALIAFLIPLLADRLGREYLIGLLPIYLLTGNILAESFTTVGIFTTSFAIPIYAATFLITDILSERYGKEESKRAVWLGFLGQIFFVAMLYIVLLAPVVPANKTNIENALGFMPRLILGSATAYVVSQFFDVWLFHRIRDITGPGKKWLRNNIATACAQLLDTLIFLGISFYGRPPFEKAGDWWLFVFSTWVVKVAVAIADTPFFYWATRAERKTK